MNEVVNFKPGDKVRLTKKFRELRPDLARYYSGTLIVSNVPCNIWSAGNSFKVFNPNNFPMYLEGDSDRFELVIWLKQKGT